MVRLGQLAPVLLTVTLTQLMAWGSAAKQAGGSMAVFLIVMPLRMFLRANSINECLSTDAG